MWTSETHLCRHKRIHVIVHGRGQKMALWSHSQVQHRRLGRKLTFSKCLVKAWDSGQSSGGGLANLVGVCAMAIQSCPWQAKWPWAILIPSSLIFFLSCEVCGNILILWIRKQSLEIIGSGLQRKHIAMVELESDPLKVFSSVFHSPDHPGYQCLTTQPVILIKLSIVSLMKILILEVLRIWEKALRKELGEFPGSWPCPDWLSWTKPHHSPLCEEVGLQWRLGLAERSFRSLFLLPGRAALCAASSLFKSILPDRFQTIRVFHTQRAHVSPCRDWLNNWTSSDELDCLGEMFSLSLWKVTLIEWGCGVKASEMYWTSTFFNVVSVFFVTQVHGNKSTG